MIENWSEATPQNGVSSIIIVRGPADGLPIRIDTDGSYTARCYTGQKPEHGGGACEFAGLWPGKYTITLEGAGVSVDVFVDGVGNAEVMFDIHLPESEDPKGCACGEILIGTKIPPECALYKKACTPIDPVGPCMVSSEGTCAAYFRYHPESDSNAV